MSMPSSSIPHPISCFIGRRRELSGLGGSLRENRLVSLVGPGGVGKTRLVLRMLDTCPLDLPAVFVELGSAPEATDAPARLLASALGVVAAADRDLTTAVTDLVGDDHLLVVLDGCENLVDQVADLAHVLLRDCPNVRICCTSVEELAVPGEVVLRLGGLKLPEGSEPGIADRAAAVRLFVDRAKAVDKGFRYTCEVAEICRRLDGVPLYLELAAEWAGVLSAAELLARLDDPFTLLKRRSRTTVARQRSLRSAIEHGYRLIGDAERDVFRRVCAFRGGFTLDQAVLLCGDQVDATDVLHVIHRLQATSFVVREETAEQSRFRILEPIRLFGLDAQDDAEAAMLRERVIDHLVELSAPLHDPDCVPLPAALVARLAAERDNLADAVAWTRRIRDERFLPLACALVVCQHQLGSYSGAAELSAELATLIDERAAVVHPVLHLAAWTAFRSGDTDASRAYATRLLDAATAAQLPIQQIRAHWVLGRLAERADDLPTYLHHARRAHELGGDRPEAQVRGWCVEYLAAAYSAAGELAQADELFDRARSILRGQDVAPQHRGWMLVNRGMHALRRGDLDEAEARFTEAGNGADKISGSGTSLAGLIIVAARRGNHELGLRLANKLPAAPLRCLDGVPARLLAEAIDSCRSGALEPAAHAEPAPPVGGRPRRSAAAPRSATGVVEDASTLLYAQGDVPGARDLLIAALDRGELRRGDPEARMGALLLLQIASLDREASALAQVTEYVERATIGEDPVRVLTEVVTCGAPLPSGTRARLAQLVPGPRATPGAPERRLAALVMLADEGCYSRSAIAHLTDTGSNPIEPAYGRVLQARHALAHGRLDELDEVLATGSAHADRHGLTLFSHYFAALQAQLAACRGDTEHANDLCRRVTAWAHPRGLTPLLVPAIRALATAALGVGDYESACRHFARPLSDDRDVIDFVLLDPRAVFDVVEAAVKAKRPVELPMVDGPPSRELTRTSFLREAARALTLAGPAARQQWEKAVAAPEADRWPFDHARVRLAYGQWLRRERNLIDARQQLGAAAQVFAELGAEPWAVLAGSELRAAGALPRPAESGKPTELTHREHEIAHMAAMGLSNKQIGQRLFISSRTVSTHLHNIFPKLFISSRAALRDALKRYDERSTGEDAEDAA